MTPAASETGELGRFLAETRAWVERELAARVPAEPERPEGRERTGGPERLVRALRYALFGDGKRLRPALVRLACRELGGTDADAAAPAAAIELVHTYSLVHDDLPCMDDDDLRRGRPTVHVAFDEATAVLVGDALLTLAFEVLARDARRGGELALVLARAAGTAGMVGGQSLDLTLEAGRDERSLQAVLDLHEKKTAALFAAAAEMGAIAAGAPERERARARDFGRALGLLFQAADDLLDVTGDAATLGKTPGKDERLERATLVAVLGVAGARGRTAELARDAEAALAALGWSRTGLAGELVTFVGARVA
jgi:geranylgeranyl pyrophosphate synthase